MKHPIGKFFLGRQDRRDQQLIQIFARRAVYMEGCKKILNCDSEKIELSGAFRVTVCGRELILRELGNNNVCAEGFIDQILFGE